MAHPSTQQPEKPGWSASPAPHPIRNEWSRRVDPSEPANLVEDEARHDERDKLLLDHFLDNADDRLFGRRNQQPIPTSCGRGFFDDDVHGYRVCAPARNGRRTTEAVDRDAAVDAKNAPTAAWKTRRRVSHTAHRRPRTRTKNDEYDPALALGTGSAGDILITSGANPGGIAPHTDVAAGMFVTTLGVMTADGVLNFAPSTAKTVKA